MKRCAWVGTDSLMIKYHDQEWGVPLHDEKKLFEFLILEGAQAGLSWITVLKKRENYRKVFDDFDYKKIAKYTEKDVKRLMNNQGIIRNQLKIKATINNAQRFMEVEKEFGSFDKYIWRFINNKPIKNKFKTIKDIPANTKFSDEISKDLKKRGFKFVGTKIVYAYMQATGMVNDHLTSCFRYSQIGKK